MCICLFTVAVLQADEITFQDLLETARKPIAIEAGMLTGEGAKILLDSANRAQFIALGEAHLNRETPTFAEALLNSVKQDRFPYLAVETGSYSAEFLQDIVNSANPDVAIQKLFKRHPRSMPFVDHQGEFRLIRRFTTDGAEPDRIWGLDQEFFFSARFLLDELLRYSKTGQAREYVAALKQRAEQGYSLYKTSGNRDSLLLDTLTRDEIAELRKQLENEDAREVVVIVNELEASREIYRAYAEKRYYANNAGRISLFKTNFMRHFNEVKSSTGDAPRVLVKMGSWHAGRGRSPVNHFDIGNFLSEFALALGENSYHIIVIAPSYVSGDEKKDLTEQEPMILPFAQLLINDQPVFVDLTKVRREMRRSILKQLPKDVVRVVYAYDAVIVMPEFNAALPVVSE